MMSWQGVVDDLVKGLHFKHISNLSSNFLHLYAGLDDVEIVCCTSINR